GHRSPVTVDGVEVPRAREPVPPLHRALRREARAALGAAALQDQAARARRHAGAEAVLPLPSAHVRLIGPFHLELRRMKRPPSRAAGRAASLPGTIPHLRKRGYPHPRRGRKVEESAARAPRRRTLSTPVEFCVEVAEIPAKPLDLRTRTGREILIERPPTRCYARAPCPVDEGELKAGGRSNRADGGEPLERRVGSTARDPQPDDVPDLVRRDRRGRARSRRLRALRSQRVRPRLDRRPLPRPDPRR